MKKILIIINNDVGLYKFRRELLEEYLEKYDVYISLPYGEYVNKCVEMGCKYIELPIDRRGMNPITDLFLIKKIYEILKQNKFDFVLTYTIKPNIYGGLLCKRLNIPYYVNVTGLGSAVENKGTLQKITIFLYKHAVKKAECIFFQNKDNLDFFKKNNIQSKSMQLVPGSGVNINFYIPLSYPKDEMIQFVFIARIMKEKGIDQYLDAAIFFNKKYPNTKFHICGYCEEEYESKLKTMEKQGIIIYHGLVDDIREILKITHCTVHPTYYPEGMSNVLLESCACARPIITTNRSGCKEIVDNNLNGYIVKQCDSKDLIEKMETFVKLSNMEKKHMGLYARKKVEKEFDRNIVVRKILNTTMEKKC